MQDFLGKDGFIWFVGVVEDRADPDKLGRVRVRCLGWHTDSREDLPHTDLPWATVMQPTTMTGLTPNTGLVEGTWVLGFFQDGDKGQNPIIMGSLPGFNLEKPDFSKGFSDPKGRYPVGTGEQDTGRHGRGTIGETHPATQRRRALKQTKVPVAKKPHLTETDKEVEAEIREAWDEVDPKSSSPSLYPFNNVRETESGILYEDDDTPGGERMLRFHPSGTHEEFEPGGAKVTKVVGENYTIIMKDDNCLISGNLNVTVEGTKRELIKGDYVLEVEGDYTQNIGENMRTKIGYSGNGNKYEEILGNYAFNINDNVKGRVDKDVDVLIGGNQSYKINGENKIQVQKDFTTIVQDNMLTQVANIYAMQTKSGIVSIKSGSKLNMKSVANTTIKSEADMDIITSGTRIDIIAQTVLDLNSGGGAPSAENRINLN